MFFPRRFVILPAVILTLFLGGCGLSLAEDVTPPPNYRPEVVEATTPQPVSASTVYPIVPPDPIQGAAIYEQKCLPCHGATGMGDGPQSGNLPNPATAIGSPEIARSARPVDWFAIVTQGNLERFMPGFSGSLNDRQRWDVVAYVYSLSASQETLEQGEAAYLENCAGCHGESGQGDGEQAASLAEKPASWSDQSLLARLSAADMVQVVSGGMEGHPSFTDKLDEAQRYAVADYVRSLSFAQDAGPVAQMTESSAEAEATPSEGEGEATPAAEQTPQEGTSAAEAPQTITITGKVTNATPGGAIPAELKVSLAAYSGMQPAYEVEVDASPDGSYIFEDVEYNSNFVYFVKTNANGLTFNSDILHAGDISGAQAELPIEIYDATSDTSALRTDRLHIFFDFTNPGAVQVVELFIISNPSDKVVISASEDQPVVSFELPVGATNLQFENGELGQRYVQTENGFGDRMSIAPGMGQHQVLFAYELPYDRKLDLELGVPLPVSAAIVMVPPAGVRVQSDQLQDAGQRDVQGMSFQMYQAVSALNAGDKIRLSLSGEVRADGAAAEAPTEMTLLYIGLGVFGVVLAGAGLWLYMQQRKNRLVTDETGEIDEVVPEEVESSETILDAIAALDDLNASGGLPQAAYQQRRAELKARLAEALEREKGQ